MNKKIIQQKKEEIIRKYGPWTAHNIQLGDDLYTMDKKIMGDEIKLRRIVQIVSDIAGNLENLRILDLACMEGLYALEFARHGAEVIGIEAREANIVKARFARELLSLDNLELVQDDVRNLSKEKYGIFDVVLCLGILYHLNIPDVFYFINNMAEVCQHFTIIDTHVSIAAKKCYEYNGYKYWGRSFFEHSNRATPEQKAKEVWASLDNPRSFWFTRTSLYNVLSHNGFTSSYECHNPPELNKPYDRITLLSIKGQKKKLISSPLINELTQENWPEEARIKILTGQKRYFSIAKQLVISLPKLIKKILLGK